MDIIMDFPKQFNVSKKREFVWCSIEKRKTACTATKAAVTALCATYINTGWSRNNLCWVSDVHISNSSTKK